MTVECPICYQKVDVNEKDGYHAIAFVLQAHVRHNHIGAYDTLFSKIERKYKVKTDHYREIKKEANDKARQLLIKALEHEKPIYLKDIVNILVNNDR